MQTLIYNKNQNTVSLTDDSGLIIAIEGVHSVDYMDKLYCVMVLPQGTSSRDTSPVSCKVLIGLISVLRVPVGRTNYILENFN